MTEMESEGGLGVELESIQWKALYFVFIKDAEKYVAENPETAYPKVFPMEDGQIIVFIKE